MPFPVVLTYTFGTMSGTVPASDLDTNFSQLATALNGINTGAYPLTNVSVTGGTWAGSPIGVTYGGTGLSFAPTNGQIPIGNGTDYSLSTLTAGTGINITNGAGSITISAPDTGTVTSVNTSGGTTGMTFTGGPITSSGTMIMSGTLAVANGGTGVTTSTGSGSVVLSNSPTLVTPALGTPSSATLTNATGLPVTGITATGTPSSTTYLRGDGSWTTVSGGSGTVTSVNASGGTTGMSFTGGPVTTAGTFTLSGTLAVANGGTGATSASAARTALGAAASGTNTDITSITLTSGTISTNPTTSTNITNKLYVDNAVAGVTSQIACQYATTADLGAVTYSNGTSGVGATLTKTSPFAVFSVDGASPTVGQRILVKNQTTQLQNGVYVVSSVGSLAAGWVLTRSTDYDSSAEITAGDAFYVELGTTNTNTQWVQQTQGTITVGTSAISFIQFGAAGSSTGIKQPYSANGAVYATSTTALTTGTLPTTGGGTGLTTFTAANNAIYSTSSSALTAGTLPIAAGGTNATTASAALSNLGGVSTGKAIAMSIVFGG